MKLALGSVQFGLDYGISNFVGKTSLEEVRQILLLARSNGINTLDTAYHYGESEKVIGQLKEISQSFHIITKSTFFSKPTITIEDVQIFNDTFAKSLSRLQRKKIRGLLIHHVDNLFSLGGEKLYHSLVQLKDQGQVEKIGVSLYTPEQGEILMQNFDVDIVQIPLNLMDQRMLETGVVNRLHSLGVEIHVRSAFLQGLFFMSKEQLPDHLRYAWTYINAIQEKAQEIDVSVSLLALLFLKGISEIDKIVIGINSLEQLEKNIQNFERKIDTQKNFETFSCPHLDIIDPSRWN